MPGDKYRPMTNSKPRSKFLLNGKITNVDDLPDVLPTQSKAKNQGTDKEIFWRKLYVNNIRKITINGAKYKVIESVEVV